MTDIKALLPEELEALVISLGEPKFRAKQIFSWLSCGATSFDEMTNLSKNLREKLAAKSYISSLKLLKKQVSQSDGTIKYLWGLRDGNAVETVLMRYKHGATVCVSSQVGCAMGCAFCASAIGGLVRNLEASEMLDEVLASSADSGERVSNVVIMGIGEPLDNLDNVLKFLSLLNHPDGLNIGMRHISLSTCAIREGLERLMTENLQLTLAISLHSACDATREKLMPANKKLGISELLRLCEKYFHKTGRRITLEYAMIDGVNDTPEQARLLAAAARRVSAHINLIPLNYVEERPFSPSTKKATDAFCKILEENGANFTLRRSLGSDVDASCGQLRRNADKDKKSV